MFSLRASLPTVAVVSVRTEPRGGLYNVIREARGLNYGDYTYLEHFRNAGQRFLPPQNVARRQQIFEMWIRPVLNDAQSASLPRRLLEVVSKSIPHNRYFQAEHCVHPLNMPELVS